MDFVTVELKASNNDCLITPLEVIVIRDMYNGLFQLHHQWIGAN